MKKLDTSFKFSKTTMLIPLFALSMHSCKEVSETGIVKDKIDNKVYLTPVNDTDNVYRVINFDKGFKDNTTKNMYLNMNRGDTVGYACKGIEIIPAERHTAFLGGGSTFYRIRSINGVKIYDLPNLVAKQKEDEAIKQLQQQYQKELNTKSR